MLYRALVISVHHTMQIFFKIMAGLFGVLIGFIPSVIFSAAVMEDKTLYYAVGIGSVIGIVGGLFAVYAYVNWG